MPSNDRDELNGRERRVLQDVIEHQEKVTGVRIRTKAELLVLLWDDPEEFVRTPYCGAKVNARLCELVGFPYAERRFLRWFVPNPHPGQGVKWHEARKLNREPWGGTLEEAIEKLRELGYYVAPPADPWPALLDGRGRAAPASESAQARVSARAAGN